MQDREPTREVSRLVDLAATAALVWALWDLWPALPQIVEGVVSSEPLVFALAYAGLVVSALVLWTVALPVVAAFLLRGDPVGRDLQAFLVVAVARGAFVLGRVPLLSWVVLAAATLLACLLYLLPGAREYLSRHGATRRAAA